MKRQIDQLGRVLGKILSNLIGIRAQGQLSKAIEAADQALETEIGLNIDSLILIPTNSFLAKLLDIRKFKDSNFEQLAEIMFIIAEEFNITNTEAGKMKKLYERSLVIYEILDKTSSTYSFDRHSKIEKIRKVL